MCTGTISDTLSKAGNYNTISLKLTVQRTTRTSQHLDNSFKVFRLFKPNTMEITEDIIQRQWTPSKELFDVEDSETAHTLKVMSYNILDDTFICKSKYRYCPKDVLYMAGRHHRIVQEIFQVDPDVVCLQEVTEEHFEENLKPDLSKLGYSGVHTKYIGPSSDGLSVFFKRSKLELLESKACLTQKWLAALLQKSHSHIPKEDKKAIQELAHDCQGCLLARFQHMPSGKTLVIGNIHVTWTRFNLPGLSCLEAACAVHKLEEFAAGSPYILTGDFNSTPDFAPYKLMSTGKFDHSLDHWSVKPLFDLYPWDDDTDSDSNSTDTVPSHTLLELENPKDQDTDKRLSELLSEVLHTNVPLKSAYKQVLGFEPPATNCEADDWKGYIHELCLDYMWYTDRHLVATSVLEAPSREVLRKHKALPSMLLPSDHVAIATVFQLL